MSRVCNWQWKPKQDISAQKYSDSYKDLIAIKALARQQGTWLCNFMAAMNSCEQSPCMPVFPCHGELTNSTLRIRKIQLMVRGAEALETFFGRDVYPAEREFSLMRVDPLSSREQGLVTKGLLRAPCPGAHDRGKPCCQITGPPTPDTGLPPLG